MFCDHEEKRGGDAGGGEVTVFVFVLFAFRHAPALSWSLNSRVGFPGSHVS